MSDSVQQDQAPAEQTDIEQQLDDLLSEVRDAPSKPVADQPVPAGEGPAPEVDGPDGDVLADQIQEMLDEAQAEVDQAVSPIEAVSEPEATASEVEQPEVGQDEVESAAKPAATDEPAPEQAAVEEEVAAEAEKGVDASALVKELDDLLAESADEAVAGDFESPEEVIAFEATIDDASGEQGEASESAATVTSGEGERDSAESSQEEDDESLLDGAFETPEELVARAEADAKQNADEVAKETGVEEDSTADESAEGRASKAAESADAEGGFGATASDVAKELDEDAAASVLDGTVATEVTESSRGPRFGKLRAVVVVVPGIAKSTCAVINRPLGSLSSDLRNTIGYVGLLTLFNASVVLIWKICSTIF